MTLSAVRRLCRDLVERFERNEILTYASAIAVQLLTAVVPLALLSFLLVGTFGKQELWRERIAPLVQDRVSAATYRAIDAVAEGLISSTHTGWLAAAVVIMIWEVSGAVRACMGALNRIFERKEDRSVYRRFATSFALAVALALCVLLSLFTAVAGGAWLDLGPAEIVWTVARWLLVVGLLCLAVALLFRFAPNGYEPPGFVTVGGIVVVVAWIGASLVFGWWVTSVADYKTPFGTMIAVLTLVGYLYTSAIVFLVGAQLNQLASERR
jgi:membrane protein